MTAAPVASEPVVAGHMLSVDHGSAFKTLPQMEYDKALAAQIFGECWAIGKCTCLWVLAIQVLIGLIRGPRWRGFELWHVYTSREKLT